MIYFLLLGAAFAIGIFWGWRNAGYRGVDFSSLRRYAIVAIIGSVLGARLFHVVFEGHLADYAADPTRAFLLWSGGLSVWGGLLGVLGATGWAFRKNRLLLAQLHDCFAPTFAAGLALTRVGCHLNGCCYGKATDMPWGVTYTPRHLAYYWQVKEGLISPAAASTIPIHPTQLYELAGAALIAVAMQIGFRKSVARPGLIAAMTLFAYSILRFVVEYFRADERGSFALGLSIPQAVALAVGTSSFIFMMKRINAKPVA